MFYSVLFLWFPHSRTPALLHSRTPALPNNITKKWCFLYPYFFSYGKITHQHKIRFLFSVQKFSLWEKVLEMKACFSCKKSRLSYEWYKSFRRPTAKNSIKLLLFILIIYVENPRSKSSGINRGVVEFIHAVGKMKIKKLNFVWLMCIYLFCHIFFDDHFEIYCLFG